MKIFLKEMSFWGINLTFVPNIFNLSIVPYGMGIMLTIFDGLLVTAMFYKILNT